MGPILQPVVSQNSAYSRFTRDSMPGAAILERFQIQDHTDDQGVFIRTADPRIVTNLTLRPGGPQADRRLSIAGGKDGGGPGD